LIRAQIERGREVRAIDYQRAIAGIGPVHESLVEIFEQRYDAVLTPAATGTAPAGLDSTGDPVFCTLWTLCGMPAISLPLLKGVTDALPSAFAFSLSARGTATRVSCARLAG
jgi:Asp-tRNA(Asn)/Glu-tRNA(Gln) amidotransferase A subunit family amidase